MTKYCFRCGKESNTKCNLNKHLRNKKECCIKYLDIPREDIINHYTSYEKDFFIIKNNIQNYQQYIFDSVTCEFCDKEFMYKTSCDRHKKYHCDKKKETDEKSKLIDEFLNTKYNLLKIEYEEKLDKTKDEISEKMEKEIEENNKIKAELEQKIILLESQLAPYAIKNNTNNINNGHIGDNNVTIINNYGEEKFTMTAQDCEKIMASEFNMIVKLIEYIHVIPPENRNAFIPSLKEKYAMVLRNQKWDLVDRTEFINNLVISKNIMLEKMLDEFGSQFEYVNPSRSRSVINYCKNDEEEYKKIKTEATLLLFNNKDTIKNTYECKYKLKIKSR
jgi:hypothetical protein